MSAAVEVLERIVYGHAGTAADWLREGLDRLAAGGADRDLFIFMGLAPRRLGKDDLRLTKLDAAAVDAAVPGWRLDGWSVDGAARVLALLRYRRARSFSDLFKDLRRTADAAELVALYRGLPVYPEPQSLDFEVGEGLRSNLKPVFEAIAHCNPFPARHFDEHRWNHMILKALFVDSLLAPIQGLDERANSELSRMLREYAHERWAAGRPVSPELWRCVGPFASDDAAVDDLARALADDDPKARKGAALGLAASPAPGAAEVLAGSDLARPIADGELTWSNLEEAVA